MADLERGGPVLRGPGEVRRVPSTLSPSTAGCVSP